LIEKINTVEDKKREEKLNKEEGRNTYVATKVKEKEDKKLKKEKIRTKALAEVKKQNHTSEKIPAKPKSDPKKPRRRVSFSDTLQVKEIPKEEKNRKNKQNPKNIQNGGQQQKKGNFTPNKKSIPKGKNQSIPKGKNQRKKQRRN